MQTQRNAKRGPGLLDAGPRRLRWTLLISLPVGALAAPPTVAPDATDAAHPPPIAAPALDSLGKSTNSPTKLETIVVTADLDADREQIAPALGAVTYTIGPRQIAALPQGENAPFSQALLRAPGVVADSLGEVHVRGEHGDLTYRVNGVLLPEGLNGFGQELDTRLIHSVTLIDGSLPAQFGFRTAGIVDVTTKSGNTLKANELSIYGGAYDTFQPSLQLGGVTGKLEYFVTTSYRHNDLGIENPAPTVRPLHDYTSQDKAFAYLSYLPDETSRLSLLLNSSYADFQLPDTPALAPKFELSGYPTANSATVNENQNEQNYYAVLAYQKTLGQLSLQASAYTRYGRIRFNPDSVGDLIFQGVAARVQNGFFANGVQFDASELVGDHHTLRVGLLADETLETLQTASQVFPVDSGGRQISDQPLDLADRHGLQGVTAGVYLQDEWRLADPVTLNYGARFDRFDASFDHEGQLSPRLNLVWQINERTSAHAGYARYFTPPSVQYVPPATLQKFAGTSAAPGVEQDDPTRVERAHYFDAGLSRQLTPDWQATADAFYKQARNLIDLGQFGSAVILSPFSYQRGTVLGSELSTTFKRGPFSTFANLSFVATSAREINSAQFEFPAAELAYIQTHDVQLDHEGRYTASAGASYTWQKDTLFYLDVLYGYGLRKGFANTEKLPGYYPVSLGVEHSFHLRAKGLRDVKLRVDCANVLDEVYRLRDGSGLGISASQYGARRSIYGGITLDF